MRRQLLFLAAVAVALSSRPLNAQSAELARVDSLINQSRFSEARTSLQQWQVRGSRAPSPDDVAYGLALRARLATRADSALAAWLELALGHPSSRHAPQALLRLGQGYAALGQHERAAGWLDRIRRDYPGFAGRHLALVWLARSQRAAGQRTAACATLTLARSGAVSDATTRRLVETEWAGCDTPSTVPRPPGATAGTADPPPGRPPAVQPAPALSAAPMGEGPYTVQVGAFRDRAAALALARRLRERDIPARVVIMAGGALSLVRAGRFRNSEEAAPLLRRVRALVPAATMASDAHREAGASR